MHKKVRELVASYSNSKARNVLHFTIMYSACVYKVSFHFILFTCREGKKTMVTFDTSTKWQNEDSKAHTKIQVSHQ